MSKILKHYKPFILLIFITIALILAQSLSELSLPAIVARIIDNGVAKEDISYVIAGSLFMLLVVALICVLSISVGYFSSKVASKVSQNIREKLFVKVMSFSNAEIDKYQTSSLIVRTTNDVEQIKNFTVMFLRIVVMAPCMCIGGIYMAYQTNAELTKYVVFAMPFIVILVVTIGKIGLPLFKRLQNNIDKLNLLVRETLTGLRVIKAFIRSDDAKEKFEKANDDLTNTSIKVNRIMGAAMPLMMLIMNLTAVMVMWFGAEYVNASHMEVGSLISFIQYVMQIMMALAMLSMIFVMLPRAIVSAKRIDEVLNDESSILDGNVELVEDKIAIAFKDVDFAYPHAEERVLHNISFEALSGETTAFIGSTGSGKSTLIALIPRFYDVSKGNIEINGKDIKEYTLESLRHKIGYVQQKGVLFTGSIKDNLMYGNPDATQEDLDETSKIAQAYDFIQEKESGYDSKIAQGGKNVSGGQRQRLSIARTLMKKPDVLIFDDSFSALDFKTDSKLRKELKKVTKDATVLIVAQRVSTIMDADKIICLNEGEIVGIGKHKELLKTCETYREIAASQLSEEEMNL